MAQQTEFIPYEQALELKELGFNEPCFGHFSHYLNEEILTENIVSAPLYQQAFRWFREKHGLSAQFSYYHVPKWTFEILEFTDIKITPNKVVSEHSKERTYEEAEHACLLKLIELAKQK